MEKEMLSIKEVAAKLSVCDKTVRRLIKAGKIRSATVGRQYRLTEEWVLDFLTNNKKGNSDE
jgi:excisionase family DNA binding protein